MNRKEMVLVEATRVVDDYAIWSLSERYEALMEIIRKGDEITEVDIDVATKLVRDMNCLLQMMLGSSLVFEKERYHLFLDPNGWLTLVKGKEIGND